MGDRVGDRRRGRALRRLARAQKRLAGPVDHVHCDVIGRSDESQIG